MEPVGKQSLRKDFDPVFLANPQPKVVVLGGLELAPVAARRKERLARHHHRRIDQAVGSREAIGDVAAHGRFLARTGQHLAGTIDQPLPGAERPKPDAGRQTIAENGNLAGEPIAIGDVVGIHQGEKVVAGLRDAKIAGMALPPRSST